MQIGRERATLRRWLAVAVGLLLACATSWVWWPSAAACRGGDMDACQLRAFAVLLPESLPPLVFFDRYPTIEWPDSRGRVVVQSVDVLPAIEVVWRSAKTLILARFAVFGVLFLAGIVGTYSFFGRVTTPPSDPPQRVIRGTRIVKS